MKLNRVEFLGDRRGRSYQISLEDERVIYLNGESVDFEDLNVEIQNKINRDLDYFEEGFNEIKLIDGQYFEVLEIANVRIERKAYEVEEVLKK